MHANKQQINVFLGCKLKRGQVSCLCARSESVWNTRQRREESRWREIDDSPQIRYNLLKGLFSYIPLHPFSLLGLLMLNLPPPGALELEDRLTSQWQSNLLHQKYLYHSFLFMKRVKSVHWFLLLLFLRTWFQFYLIFYLCHSNLQNEIRKDITDLICTCLSIFFLKS